MNGSIERKVPEWLARLEGRSRALRAVVALAILAVAAVADHALGWRVGVHVLYAVAIAWTAWLVGIRVALGISLLAAVVTTGVAVLAGHPGTPAHILPTRFVADALLFVAIAFLAGGYRRTRSSRQQLRLSDPLTGIATSDRFYDEGGRQVKTAVRYQRPVSLAYIGVDNFAGLNTRFGHKTGDDVLVSISQTLREGLRDTDLVARLAGDEFSVLFPEADSEAGAAAAEKVMKRLIEATDGWPIGFSLGVVTCDRASCTLHDLLRRAEQLMREAKKEGGNRVRAERFEEDAVPGAAGS